MADGVLNLKGKRWNDPRDRGDGFRLLICRYRPRGVTKAGETWDEWWPQLGPSKELHAAYYGKTGAPIGWEEYEKRLLEEMRGQGPRIAQLARRAAKEPVTLLCSSHCEDPARCHRTLLIRLAEAARR